jgi:hypothetical protein
VLALLSYGAERSEANQRWLAMALAVAGAVLGALLFAGSLATGGREAWPGVPAGVACAVLGWAAVGGLFDRARRRLEKGAAGLVSLYAEGVALALAGIAVVVPAVSYLALAAFLLLLVRGRGEQGGKYAGLRVLR